MSIKSLLVSLSRMPSSACLMTGLYCPGCGGTRAVKYLLQGDWKNSLIYHPFVLYSVIAAALWAADAIYGKVCSGRRRRASKKRKSLFLILGTAIILINWIAKNLLLVCWGIDLLAVPL